MPARHTAKQYMSLAGRSEKQAAKAKLVADKAFYLRQADYFRLLAEARRRSDSEATD